MHSRFIFALAVSTLAGCAAQKPDLWVRADGHSDAPRQADLDKSACYGEAAKAKLAAGGNYQRDVFAQAGEELDRQRAARQVFVGCMAGKGYVQPPTPANG